MRMARQQMLFGGLVVAALSMIGPIVDIRSAGAEVSPAMMAALKLGMVTSVSLTSVNISGVEYRVKANAEIQDHKGVEMKLADVLPRSEARYHLTKDNEIDMLVVRRPQ
jgi:hypothetical protein